MQQKIDFDLFKERIKETLAYHGLSGTVALSVPEETVYRESFGFADRDNGIKNPENPTYAILGNGNLFLPAAIMKLYSEGKLDLTDKISQYLPEYKHSDEITLGQVLMHTAGIPDYAGGKLFIENEKSNCGRDEKEVLSDEAAISVAPISYEKVLELIGNDALSNIPGQRMFYSATNYVFLKTIYERVSGESFSSYLQNEIIGKLKLKNTVFGYSPNTTAYAVIHEKEHFRLDYRQKKKRKYPYNRHCRFYRLRKSLL